MRPITVWLFGSLSVFLIAAPTPSNAAIIRQNFELTVTNVLPPANQPDSSLSNFPLPAIGTKGFGSYTYDESQLNFSKEFSVYEDTYSLGVLGKIAFLDFSLDFFNRTYTERVGNRTRIGEIFLFNRTSSGQFTPQNPFFDTAADGTTISIGAGGFTYYPASPFTTSASVTGSAGGTFSLTDAEPVPEPPFSAIVPVLALGLGCLCQRKRAN